MKSITCIVRYTRTDLQTAIRDVDRRKHISISAGAKAATLQQAAHAELHRDDKGGIITGVRIMRICGGLS
jgi:hypothetical protein